MCSPCPGFLWVAQGSEPSRADPQILVRLKSQFFTALLSPEHWSLEATGVGSVLPCVCVTAEFSAWRIALFPEKVDGTLCSPGQRDRLSSSDPFSSWRKADPSPGAASSTLLFSLRVGLLDVLNAAPCATVPAPASFRTARASTASVSRSSSDEGWEWGACSLGSGQPLGPPLKWPSGHHC